MAGETASPVVAVVRRALFGIVGLALLACTPTTKLDSSAHVAGRARVGVTQGSAVAVTQDESVAVVADRSEGVVSILHLDPTQDAAKLVTGAPPFNIAFRPLNEAQPWAVVIGADDDTAYVLVRGLAQVARLVGLHGRSPHVDRTIAVGSEPTSIVISPSGKWLYVANWGEGTVSNILVDQWSEARWDLNRRLADEAFLGPLVGEGKPPSAVWTKKDLELHRPGLAHPRALAMTDDGDADDSDELLYATEFFAQPLPNGGPAGVDDLDHSRVGLVYPIQVADTETERAGDPPPDTNVIQLMAVELTFTDSAKGATACFPNQLYSAATSGDRLYVTSICASPSGPTEAGPMGDANNFKTMLHSAVFAIDTTSNRQVSAKPLILTEALRDSYAADRTADDTPPPSADRMPLLPVEIVVAAPDAAGNRQGYLSAMGSGAVYPITFAPNDSASVGSAGRRYIDLGHSAMPVGVALLSNGRGLIVDDKASTLRALDLAASRSSATADTLDPDLLTKQGIPPTELLSPDARDGRQLFATGLTAWSLKSQGWSSCESCHPEGLSDGVTWRFTRGPRRTISLAGTYYRDEPARRVLLWGANIDEVHDLEAIARGLSGGIGGVVWNPYAEDQIGKDCRLLYDGKSAPAVQDSSLCSGPLLTTTRQNGLNGSLSAITRTSKTDPHCNDGDPSCDVNGSLDWGKIDSFLHTIRAPHAPSTLDWGSVGRGQALFEKMKCSACHAGPGWTLSHVFYEPGPAANGRVPDADPRVDLSVSPLPLDEMLGSLRTKQYTIPDAGDAQDAFGPAGTRIAFRVAPPTDASADTILDYIFGLPPAKDGEVPRPAPPADQIKCVLRSVGTFPDQTTGENKTGITAGGDAPPAQEVRLILNGMAYDEKLALGATGFNIPSLVGLSLGGPYFHAGNARTLEESFDTAFEGHYAAMGVTAPSSDEIRDLVSYLLSLDESIDEEHDTAPVAVPNLGFNPDLCAPFVAP
jgi:hypothetical protein